MKQGRKFVDYEPVTPAGRATLWDGESGVKDWPTSAGDHIASEPEHAGTGEGGQALDEDPLPSPVQARKNSAVPEGWATGKRGHSLSYFGLFLFTAAVYIRPYELTSISWLSSLAFVLAVATLLVYVPSQLAMDGTLTARPREVNLVLLLCLAGFLSIPLAINPGEAWAAFVIYLKVVLMFIVMVNVVRTERRLKWMILFVLAISILMSLNGLNEFRLGHFELGGLRIKGTFGSLFENPNDMALHLLMIVFITVGLLLSSKSLLRKLLYAVCLVLMLAATVITFSRGAFLALLVASLVTAWKLGRRNRLGVMLAVLVVSMLFLALVPGGYGDRLKSIFDSSLDTGSASSRQELLWQSVRTTIRHPLLGIGMDNFHNVSTHEQVSHNAYTQVGAEMGIPAMVIYIMFLLTALKRLRKIERETFAARRGSRFYYLAVGMQASLVSYMISSFFASVAYQWYVYYLVGYILCLHRLYEAEKTSATQADAAQAEAASPALRHSQAW